MTLKNTQNETKIKFRIIFELFSNLEIQINSYLAIFFPKNLKNSKKVRLS